MANNDAARREAILFSAVRNAQRAATSINSALWYTASDKGRDISGYLRDADEQLDAAKADIASLRREQFKQADAVIAAEAHGWPMDRGCDD